MILFEKPVVQNQDPDLNNIEEDSEDEDSSDEYSHLPPAENEDDSDRGFIYLPTFNLNLNYWNNLNLMNFNQLKNFNLRNTSVWKIYENGVENFSKTTGFMINRKPDSLDLLEEFADLDFHDIFISSSKKGIKDPEERFLNLLHPNLIDTPTSGDQTSILDDDSSEDEDVEDPSTLLEKERVVLSEEFWSSIIATTEGHSDGSVNLSAPEGNIMKAPLNPFFHRTKFNFYNFIKVAFGTIFLLPIRLIGMFLSLVVAWALASIATTGITYEELQSKPVTGWRKGMRWVIANIVMRVLFFFVGFHWIKKKGVQASSREAPILVVAPHSSYFDAFPLILMGAPSVVAKSSVRKVPFFGKLVDLTQAVYVSREQASSRQNTVQQIKKRALSGEDWPQIYIYPEGTCSNRSCMIQFKSGAFLPGVPVQPVLIKYPNRFDSITWTFDGPQVLKTWWWTMSQFTNYCELEFLPVYTPSEEEKADVSLYANNVRQVMAEAMGVPVTDYVFEDGLEMSKINTVKLSEKLKNIARLRTELKLTSLMEMNIIKNMLSDETFARLTLEEFTVKMNLVGSTPKVVEDLFKLFNLSGEGRIDLREYLIFSVLINPSVRVDRVMPAFFLLYSESRKRMSLDGFTQFMQCIFQVPADEAHILFSAYTPQGDMMDLEVFGRRLKKRLEYIRLYALEATNLLSIYPPRDREINSTRHHPQSQPPHSNVKPKEE